MFLIRQALPADFDGVFPLAKLLNSYNVPADRGYVRELLSVSRDSFRGGVPKERARYLFVLENVREQRIIGCSLIIAKHGTKGRPHLWFALEKIEKKSRTLRRHFCHEVLRLGFTEDGPTQIGGLIVLPAFRKHPAHCGMQLSYVRFLYMAMHPERFRKTILVEYRGISHHGQRSPFWEAVGKIFTGLSYKEADRLSVTNKEFILGLMPREPIFRALLPGDVERTIGAIHPAARPAVRLLEAVGFRPVPQVEPFDAGRYYAAPMRKVGIFERGRGLSAAEGKGGKPSLIGTEKGGLFRAVCAKAQFSGGRCLMARETLSLLGLRQGDTLHASPL